MKLKIQKERPSVSMLESELARLKYISRYRLLIKSTVCTILMFTSAALLAATLWFPVLQVYGNSMSPALQSGDVLICLKTDTLTHGEITAFYHNNKILVKRVIGCPGDRVNIDRQGIVSVNEVPLSEPYIQEHSTGQMDIPLPCQVPQEAFFVMGDRRATSLDSRSESVGFIPRERILGKVLFRVWPLHRAGIISRTGG